MKRLALLCLAAAGVMSFGGAFASTPTVNVIYSFCAKTDCADGNFPVSTPVVDSAGTAYVTADIGGKNNQGSVVSIDKHGKADVLYSFCPKAGCSDGANPLAGLVLDDHGNLYGMTNTGGPSNKGVVFELSPSGKKWKYKVLHKFCSAANCPDGASPIYTALTYQGAASGTVYDGTSPLYGVTQYGGASNLGAAFTLSPSGKKWKQKVIYDFCSQDSCTDGYEPRSGLTVDASGNLFGTTSFGGANGDAGVIYELEKHGSKFKQAVLYNFCSKASCADGQDPIAPPYLDGQGNLFGTTTLGGANGQGSVFKLVLKTKKLTTLHSFCSEADCTDGEQPFGDVSITAGADGNLYGTAEAGGDNGRGLLFSLSGSNFKFSKAYSFTVNEGCGSRAGLRLGASGALYGTCASGGLGGGTVYTFTP
jgi:uncharacterized repeat protein (TIGR03803 family)